MSEATSSPTPNNTPTKGPLLDTPQVLEVLEQPCAKVRIEVPAAERNAALPAAGADLNAALEQQGIPRISFFTHHLSDPSSTEVRLELCALTAKPVAATGRVQPGTWPAGTYARVIFSGQWRTELSVQLNAPNVNG